MDGELLAACCSRPGKDQGIVFPALFMQQFKDLAETTLRFSIRRTNAYKGVSRASAADHKRVADLIIRGEAAQAQSAMFALIHGALELLLAAGGHAPRGHD